MYWESNQQQFKFSPCSGQKAKEVEKRRRDSTNIGAPQFFVRLERRESITVCRNCVIEPNVSGKKNLNIHLGNYVQQENSMHIFYMEYQISVQLLLQFECLIVVATSLIGHLSTIQYNILMYLRTQLLRYKLK